jgi:hypothetical protein
MTQYVEVVHRIPVPIIPDLDLPEEDGVPIGFDGYEALQPNEHGWLWCAEFDAWLGLWDGVVYQTPGRWLRFFDQEGSLIPMEPEAERERANTTAYQLEAERRRADAAEAELGRLREELARLRGDA